MLCFAFRFECLDFRAPFLKTAHGLWEREGGERERESECKQARESYCLMVAPYSTLSLSLAS